MSENPNPDVSTLTSHPQSITLTPSRALLRHSPKFQGNHVDSFSFCFPLSRSFRPGLLPTLSQIALLASFCRLGAFSSALFSPNLNLVSPSTVFFFQISAFDSKLTCPMSHLSGPFATTLPFYTQLCTSVSRWVLLYSSVTSIRSGFFCEHLVSHHYSSSSLFSSFF